MIVPIPLEGAERDALKASLMAQMTPLDDAYSPLTAGAFNAPGTLDVLHRFCEPVSVIAGTKLRPVSTFGRVSHQGAVLHPHTDRETLDWTVTFPLDPLSAHWRFIIAGTSFRAFPGQGILANGRRVEHWREPCPFGPSCWLLLHYQEDHTFAPIVARGFLSPEDRRRVAAALRDAPPAFVPGRTSGDDRQRQSDIAWLDRQNPHWAWLYARIVPWMQGAAPRAYPLDAWQDGIQYTRYDTGGFYGLHRDNDGNNRRVLSCTILLQPPAHGGELEVEGEVYPLQPGDAVLFPSSALHQVRPCEGIRESLVVWLSGGEPLAKDEKIS